MFLYTRVSLFLSQDAPEEVVEDESGYEEEGFEEYSDEFDGEGDQVPSAGLAVVVGESSANPRARPNAVGANGAGFRPSGSPVVSPALKLRPTDDVQAPDDKVICLWVRVPTRYKMGGRVFVWILTAVCDAYPRLQHRENHGMQEREGGKIRGW